jgi:hypothetical protein
MPKNDNAETQRTQRSAEKKTHPLQKAQRMEPPLFMTHKLRFTSH